MYADRLKQLADEASAAAHPSAALRAWREALQLLPAGSRQHEAVLKKIQDLVPLAEAAPILSPADSPRSAQLQQPTTPAGPQSWWKRVLAPLGVSGAFLAKFIVPILAKAKLLLLGLTKLKTFASMALYFAIYWKIWGWKFALGIVLSIYIHEMGHVVMLNQLGIPATAPMFIPFLGAFIRLKENPPTAHEDAKVGLAGPMWGLGAAAAAYGLSLALHSQLMLAVASVGAWINLFNLTPVWSLDGSRGFRALTRVQRWGAVGALGIALYLTRVDILWLVTAVAVFRAFEKETASEPDNVALGEYVFLVATLSILAWMGKDLVTR